MRRIASRRNVRPKLQPLGRSHREMRRTDSRLKPSGSPRDMRRIDGAELEAAEGQP
jgi:hypothetical protein